jgi:hypothetical protein
VVDVDEVDVDDVEVVDVEDVEVGEVDVVNPTKVVLAISLPDTVCWKPETEVWV